ncbi:MAG: PmbA/TldA family metallopeptidase, partial [Methanobacteriota archaeon]
MKLVVTRLARRGGMGAKPPSGSDLVALAEKAVREADRAGADEAEAFVVSERGAELGIEANALNQGETGEAFGLGIRLLRKGRVGFAFASSPAD